MTFSLLNPSAIFRKKTVVAGMGLVKPVAKRFLKWITGLVWNWLQKLHTTPYDKYTN